MNSKKADQKNLTNSGARQVERPITKPSFKYQLKDYNAIEHLYPKNHSQGQIWDGTEDPQAHNQKLKIKDEIPGHFNEPNVKSEEDSFQQNKIKLQEGQEGLMEAMNQGKNKKKKNNMVVQDEESHHIEHRHERAFSHGREVKKQKQRRSVRKRFWTKFEGQTQQERKNELKELVIFYNKFFQPQYQELKKNKDFKEFCQKTIQQLKLKNDDSSLSILKKEQKTSLISNEALQEHDLKKEENENNLPFRAVQQSSFDHPNLQKVKLEKNINDLPQRNNDDPNNADSDANNC